MSPRWLVMVAGTLAAAACAQVPSSMIAPSLDDMSREWCFLAKTTTVIGMPFQPDVTQVTYDGSLYTGSAELCFFWGPNQKPLFARQRTFLDGYIPVVEYAWRDGSLKYSYEAFAAELPGEGAANTVDFVRFRVTNEGSKPAKAQVLSALRHRVNDYRIGGIPFKPDWTYWMGDGQAVRDGRVVYLYPPGGSPEAVPGTRYTKAFVGSALGVTARQEVCLNRYERELMTGQSLDLDFKMPRVPVRLAESAYLAKLRAANYDRARAETVAYWKRAVNGAAKFDVPEARVQDGMRASLVHMMLATRERDGKRFQTDGLPYPDLFLSSFSQMEMAYDFLGRPDDMEQSLDQVLARQSPDGIFMDTSLPQNGQPLIAAHGQTLFALAYHYVLTHHARYGERVFPAVVRAVAWIEKQHETDEYGLMPPSWPYDAEMIKGRYTSHNLWCLLGLREAIRMAEGLGRRKQAAEWRKLEASYDVSLLQALRASARADGSVPTGLYKYVTGEAARAGFKEYQTDQDWENTLLAAPTEVLDPGDPLVKGTIDRMHRMKFREGVMTYRDGQHIHQYVTANVVEQEIARGDQRQALTDYYHMILHNGPTGEGFENLVEPWTRQVADFCPPPHAWAAAKLALLTREMLIVERGGKAGMDPGQRELHLFSVMSPAWAVPGRSIGFRNAPCEMGKVTAKMTFSKSGATLNLAPAWNWMPRRIVVAIPYFVRLRSCRGDVPVHVSANEVSFAPTARRIEFKWSIRPEASAGTIQRILLEYRREPNFELKDGNAIITPGKEGSLTAEEKRIPPAPLSFKTVLEAYRLEYARRYRLYLRAGRKPVLVTPPSL